MLVVRPAVSPSREDLFLAEVDYRYLPVLLGCRHSGVYRRQHRLCRHLLVLLAIGHWVVLPASVGVGSSCLPCPVAKHEASVQCLLLAVSNDHVRSSTARHVVGTAAAATLLLLLFYSGYLL